MTLDVPEPSVVELTVRDKVQLDPLTRSGQRSVAVRHGSMLRPGSTKFALERGFYLFRTVCDANLKVVPLSRHGGEGPPIRGHEVPGEVSNLTVE